MSNILLIEPGRRLAQTYKDALMQAGFNVDICTHAEQAVHQADSNRPDLVIMELQLQVHNGIEFLHEFRSYSEWQSIPVVVLTMVGPHMLMITDDVMEKLGIVRCLYKPATTLKQLLMVVNQYIPANSTVYKF